MSTDPRRGRKHDFDRVVSDHYRGLEHFVRSRCQPSEADDVLAATLITAWRRFDDRPRGAERGWLYRIALNTARNAARSAHRRQAAHARLSQQHTARSVDLYHDAVPDDTIERLNRALSKLSDADRDIIELASFGGLVGADLAAALGVSTNTAGVRLHRARRRLQALFEQGDER